MLIRISKIESTFIQLSHVYLLWLSYGSMDSFYFISFYKKNKKICYVLYDVHRQHYNNTCICYFYFVQLGIFPHARFRNVSLSMFFSNICEFLLHILLIYRIDVTYKNTIYELSKLKLFLLYFFQVPRVSCHFYQLIRSLTMHNYKNKLSLNLTFVYRIFVKNAAFMYISFFNNYDIWYGILMLQSL